MSSGASSFPLSPSVPRAAVIGAHVAHSLSPRLHGFWLRAYGIAGAYDAWTVAPEALREAMATLRRGGGWRGVNVTVPHKEAVTGLVDRLDDDAARIGAVNLVTVEADGSLTGRNTDAYGFAENLRAGGYGARGGHAVVLGAGGAARAVVAALRGLGAARIVIVNRDAARADALAQAFGVETVGRADLPEALRGAELLVNATSLGMAGQDSLAIDLTPLPAAATVCDLVYAPLDTGLLRAARARGLAAIDGLGMLLHQARPAFRAFFGRDPEVSDGLRAFVLAGAA